MTAGEKRKYYRNMQFERTSRQIGVAALSLVAFMGPVAFVLIAAFMLYTHSHSGSHVLQAGAPAVVAGFRMSDLKWRGASNHEVLAVMRGKDRIRSERGFGYRKARNEVAPGLTSFRDGWYWDSFSVAQSAAFPTTQMFSVAQGNAGKTLAQTNLTGQGGQLPAGQVLTIKSIRVYISNTTVPADLQNILTNCSIEFKVNNTPIYQATPGWFPAGYGGVVLAAANVGTVPAGSSAIASTTNGFPHQTAVYDFKYPYTLESSLNFTVLVTPQTAFNMTANTANPVGVGTTIVVTLEGEKQQIVVS